MTTDPVRDYLNSVLEYRMEAKRLKRKLAQLEAQATNITSQLTGMPHGGIADRGAVLASLADAAKDYQWRIDRAERKELEVLDFIDSLPTAESRTILKLRYLDCKRWPKVLAALNAGGMAMSERQMYRLHGRALQEARERYNDERS